MKEIGKILRNAREARNISVEEVNIKTHIPLKYVTALEEGDRSQFPAEVYYTGSLRRYAQFLNLNEEELVARFKTHETKAKVAVEEAKKPKRKSRTTIAYPQIFIGIGICVVILLIVFAISRILTVANQQSTIQEMAAPAPSASTGTVTSTIITSATVPSPDPAPAAAPAAPAVSTPTVTAVPKDGLKLSITSIKDTWMRVTVDNTVVYDGILTSGGHKEWTARKRYHIVFGFLTGVKALLNDRPIEVAKLADPNTNELWLTKDTLTGTSRRADPSMRPAMSVSSGTAAQQRGQ